MNNTVKNPYVGPRTFQREDGDIFFGREREARDIMSLVASERLVLFYAQSGAGKSSLLNTRIIPELEDGEFEVLPVGRVQGDLPPDLEVENVYVFNLLNSLLQQKTNPQALAKLPLSEFLCKLDFNEGGYSFNGKRMTAINMELHWRRILIVDQFEEIFTTHMDAWVQRSGFFRQLAQALQDDPYLTIILTMRDDYIASLDLYAHLLPGGLRTRYYMQRLTKETALKAVKNPVETIRPFSEGVAEKLVEDLSGIVVYRPSGVQVIQSGQYVEPVQLQVVCYSLWENLSPEGTEITAEDLQEVGDVDQSLASFYNHRVAAVAKERDISERTVREWFDKELITGNKTRNMVLQEKGSSAGLPNEVIQALQGDLVRTELRAGQIWIELSHDRLVEPVLASNAKWFEQNLSVFQRRVVLWVQQGRSEGLLLGENELAEAEKEVSTLSLTKEEQEFLEESKKQIKRLQRDQAQRRIIFSALIVSVLLLVAAIFFGIRSKAAENDANEKASIANTAQALAINERNDANAAKATAQAASTLAVEKEKEAQEKTQLARSGEIAAQSVALLDQKSQLALLLSVEAYKRSETFQSLSALLANTEAHPHLSFYLNKYHDGVSSVVFSPDGTTMASIGDDDSVILWDMRKDKPIGRYLAGQTEEWILSVTFSQDGKTLTSGNGDGSISLWDVETGQPIGQPIIGQTEDWIGSLALSPDGTTVAYSVGSYSTLIIWDLTTGKPLNHPPISSDDDLEFSPASYADTLAFSPDDKILAASNGRGTIILWDAKTGKSIGQPLTGQTYDWITSLAFSPDGKILASGSQDGTISLWMINTGQPIGQPLTGHATTVDALAFSLDGKTLASGSGDRTIILWDVETGKPIEQPLIGHADVVSSVAFSPDGTTLVSGSTDGTIILWDLGIDNPIGHPLIGDTYASDCVAFSPDGKTLASCDADSSITLWDIDTDKPIGQLISNDWLGSIAFSPDGKTLASGNCSSIDSDGWCNRGDVILWDVEKRKSIGHPLTGHTDIVLSLAFSQDGKILASGSQDATIMLWDMEKGRPIGEPLIGPPCLVDSVTFNPDGKILASGNWCNNIVLWDIGTGKQIGQPLEGHTTHVTSVAFSPDGTTLASASFDGTIILWDVETGQLIGQPLIGHNNGVLSVAFSPNGKIIASGSEDNTIILWDVATRQPIGQPIKGHSDEVTSVAFNPDGKTLASASWDGTVILWNLDPQAWIEKSCQRAGRNFTYEEWYQYFPDEKYHTTCP